MYDLYKKHHVFSTGDLLLFDGKGPISVTIKRFTFSKWSHVGLVAKLDDNIFCFESTTLADTSGVQMTLLSERLRAYEGRVAVRHLLNSDGSMLQPEQKNFIHRVILDFRQEVRGRPYEKSKLELILAAYDGPFGENKQDLSSLFCSELVAEALQRARVLDITRPSNEFTPADFSAEVPDLREQYGLTNLAYLK